MQRHWTFTTASVVPSPNDKIRYLLTATAGDGSTHGYIQLHKPQRVSALNRWFPNTIFTAATVESRKPLLSDPYKQPQERGQFVTQGHRSDTKPTLVIVQNPRRLLNKAPKAKLSHDHVTATDRATMVDKTAPILRIGTK